MKLSKIAEQIRQCRKCLLWRSRKKAVPGEGPSGAKIFLIGQGPGKEEDRTGRPFMGKAGRFLDELLRMNKIKRKKIFITSIVKCYPPKNRAPKKKEYDICIENYLLEQIKAINPEKIVVMGNVAKKALRGRLTGREVLYTHHPAAGMRFPKIRKKMILAFKKI